jgi:hypothetical protein
MYGIDKKLLPRLGTAERSEQAAPPTFAIEPGRLTGYPTSYHS